MSLLSFRGSDFFFFFESFGRFVGVGVPGFPLGANPPGCSGEVGVPGCSAGVGAAGVGASVVKSLHLGPFVLLPEGSRHRIP
jgi:hypothetical protein